MDTYACKSDFTSISLQRSIHQGIGLACNVSTGFCVGECLISSSLMQTLEVGDCSGTGCGCSITEKTEDRILDTSRVIDVQVHSDAVEEAVVRVFLGDFTASEHSTWNRESDQVLSRWHRSCRCEAKEGNKH